MIPKDPYSNPMKLTRYWQISPGNVKKRYWPEFKNAGIIGMGWDYLGDLGKYSTYEQIKKALLKVDRAYYKNHKNPVNDIKSILIFSKDVRKDDIIVAKKGASKEIYGIGKVKQPYRFDDSRQKFKHIIDVDWIIAFDENTPIHIGSQFVQWTANPLDPKRFEEIKDVMLKSDPKLAEKFDLLHIDGKNGDSDDNFKRAWSILEKKKQIILYGPPGTGKTFFAKQLAIWILSGEIINNPQDVRSTFKKLQEKTFVELVQFHPAYSYEDFIEGIRPVTNEDGKLCYEVQSGTFKSLCSAQVEATEPGIFAKVENYTPLSQPFVPTKLTLQQYGINKVDETVFTQILDEIETERPFLFDGKKLSEFGNRFYVLRLKEGSGYLDRPRVQYHYPLGIQGSRQLTNDLEKGKVAFAYYDLKRGGIFGLGYFNGMERIGESKNNEPIKRLLIIDEINRGNIAKIFGELIYALEYRGEAVKLQYSGSDATKPEDEKYLSVPDNLYIIGTMNTADRSIALVDMALRRRFSFIERMPDIDFLARFLGLGQHFDEISFKEKYKNATNQNERLKLLSILSLYTLNQKIISNSKLGREKQIGHSYLTRLKEDTESSFLIIWKYEIIPLLEEYYYFNYSEIEELLGNSIITKNAGIKPFEKAELTQSLEKLCSM